MLKGKSGPWFEAALNIVRWDGCYSLSQIMKSYQKNNFLNTKKGAAIKTALL